MVVFFLVVGFIIAYAINEIIAATMDGSTPQTASACVPLLCCCQSLSVVCVLR